MSNKTIDSALQRKNESSDVDFKSSFDVGSNRDWLELTKDIAAFANSGGGIILVGLNDDGTPSNSDVSSLLGTDLADIGNRLFKYFGQHFNGVELVAAEKDLRKVCAIKISGSDIPIVFSRVGEIELPEGKKKTVFALGSIYFRHNSKSEPGSADDLRQFIDRRLELTRKAWLEGIAKVVEAPAGSRIVVAPPDQDDTEATGSSLIQLTRDPTAPAYYAVPLDTTHPFRQKEVVNAVNEALVGKRAVNSHDILCIRRVHLIDDKIEYCYKQKFASPRYSKQFVDWIVDQFCSDATFFEQTRTRHDAKKVSNDDK